MLDAGHLFDRALLAVLTDQLSALLGFGQDFFSGGLGLSQFTLTLFQGLAGGDQTLLSIFEVRKDRLTATLEDVAEESLEEIHQQRDHEDQVDEVGLKGVEVQGKPVIRQNERK